MHSFQAQDAPLAPSNRHYRHQHIATIDGVQDQLFRTISAVSVTSSPALTTGALSRWQHEWHPIESFTVVE